MAIRKRIALATAALALGSGLATATPAQAVTYPAYADKAYGECLEGRSLDTGPLALWPCDNSSEQDWEVESRPQSGTSNDVVKLRNIRYNRCLDSHAGVNNDYLFNISCNTGNYQLWEVFYNSNGTRTFKSWGAWRHQGLHLCLSSNPAGRDFSPLLKTCNRNSAYQQWTRRV
ncbi:RICIN domain-containing protein [Streptomyces sp. NBC_00878]|uniref:RICIN domain-containing protein n=1 Tax=Streptomyces sp. NBC_00878 TaxID=2975854 RepID=UPI00225A9FEA|nr:RICIN domain-containing protein [Streptomyces sp. NBC_00878]MCX4909093.1 RICIN domain-containing protein [Streptomyces sp. NBC_00878]